MMRLFVALTCALFAGSTQATMACEAPPAPLVVLDFGSRYSEDSETRSETDAEGEAEAEAALDPIDDFLRDLTERSNAVLQGKEGSVAEADCVVQQIAVWANENALGDLQSETAALTIGSRIAGFALVMLQVTPQSTRADDISTINHWLADLMLAQMMFWEQDAPKGARQGNLRAWAALAGSTTARLTHDPVIRAWSTWSISYLLCTASEDGSLPREMARGRLALSYQLHAIAPLVVSTLLLKQEGVDLTGTCDNALRRIVDFAMADLQDGAKTQAITGEVQSFFDGSDTLEGFHLAWVVAYLQLDPAAASDTFDGLEDRYGPLNYSKLGGKQTLLWDTVK
jgi:poly(beta-D-mannuronate) lyase